MKTAFLIVLFFAASFTLFAQPGSLDSSFRTNGLGVDDFGNDETIVSSALQTDGKIIFVGSDVLTTPGGRKANACALARYNANGTPDSSFGKNGLITIVPNGNGKADWGSVALQADGKIIITGALYIQYPYSYYPVVFRCTKEGMVDSSFGVNGFVQPTAISSNTYLYDIKVQPDGKIVTAGQIDKLASGNSGSSMVVYRFTKNGGRDKTFGKNGEKIISIGHYSIATALQVLANGNILVAGNAYPPEAGSGYQLATVQLTASGKVDTTFGDKGGVITTINDYTYTRDLIITGNGQFVIGGATSRNREVDFLLARYNADGSLDSSFGTNGIATTDFGRYDDITRLALQPDGKIVAFGITETDGSSNKYRAKFALARYKKNGKPDTGFGNNGIVTTDFGSNEVSQAYTGFIQANGRIVAAGITAYPNRTNDFALAGYQSSGRQPALPIAKCAMADKTAVAVVRRENE